MRWTAQVIRIAVFLIIVSCTTAIAQVTIDISADEARKVAGIIYLEDLAVHDTALIYQNFCVKDSGLYIPGWTVPANLAADSYTASGIILRIEIIPGGMLRVRG